MKWAEGAVIYQIFVDRFNNGNGENDVTDGEYNYIEKSVQKKAWGEIPEPFDVINFHGGDLQGVIDKLDYLQSLGVEVLYFNPIFSSPSNHKYDIEDYYHVDRHFGGNEAFAKLTSEMHSRGMKVILDGVFNHCSDQHPWVQNPDYFMINANGEYESWWNVKTLPKFNYDDSPELVDKIMEVAKFWMREPYCIDGWRLDVAADLGHSKEFNHGFWKRFREEVKSVNPDAIIIAEHYGDASAWLKGDEWDTVMNYDGFMDPLSLFLTGMEKHSYEYTESAIGDAQRFKASVDKAMASMSYSSFLCAMNELDNHDHSRFLTRTNHVVGRLAELGSEAAEKGVNTCILRQAMLVQFTMPGAPTIYYGDEAGLCGFTDPDSRRDYPWGKEDKACIEFCKGISRIHNASEVLKHGKFRWITTEKNLLIYERYDESERFITVIYTGTDEKDIYLDVHKELEGIMYTDCWNFGFFGEPAVPQEGKVRIRVKPHGGYLIKGNV